MKRLNLGSGCEYREGWINHDHPDIDTGFPVERKWDLNQYPWKCFEDNEFDLVDASHILEHLNDVVPAMKELTRVVKPGGTLIIRVPHFSRTWVHPMHKIAFPLAWYGSIVGEGWLPEDLELKSVKMTWGLERIYRSSGKLLSHIGNVILNPLANMYPMLCERIWANWVGGFDEVEFVFEKKMRL